MKLATVAAVWCLLFLDDVHALSTPTSQGRKRVVVTGMGITSCLGTTLEDVLHCLQEAKSGIEFSEELAKYGYSSQVRGLPPLTQEDMKNEIPKKHYRFCGNNGKYAYIAMKRAIEDAKLEDAHYRENPRAACFVGQGGPSVPDIMETVDAVKNYPDKWKSKVGPFRIPRVMLSSCAANLATAFQVQGPSYGISSACSSSGHCIGTGMEQILLGRADLAFCGAGQDAGWEFTAAYDCMGAISSSYNDSPKTASRAFDKTRDGFVMAGGGGIVVLEELEHAKARGARIYGELVGYAATADGFDMVKPSGTGAERCMQLAIEDAKLSCNGEDKVIDYINTHGTSTPVGDGAELLAIKRVFDKLGYQPNIGSTKSLSGHCLSAAGVHETIYTLLMMNNDFMAESANIQDLMEEAEGLNILTSKKVGPFRRAMSNSFGFGGTNCCLIYDKYEE